MLFILPNTYVRAGKYRDLGGDVTTFVRRLSYSNYEPQNLPFYHQ